MTSGGSGNEFVEEKCAPMKREKPTKKPVELPKELKPKFPVAAVPETPPVPTPFIEVTTPPVNNQNNQATPLVETPSVDNEVQTADTNSQYQEKTIGEEKDVGEKKKKKAKKPKKPNDETAVAVFMNEEEAKADGSNAVGQFIEEEDPLEDKKKPAAEKKEKEKKPAPKVEKKKPAAVPVKNTKPASVFAKKDKEQPSCRKPSVVPKEKEPASVRRPTNVLAKEKEQPSARKPNKSIAVNVVKDDKDNSFRKKAPAKKNRSLRVLKQSVEKVTGKDKDPHDGFFKAMYSKAKTKIATMAKNPNIQFYATEDTLVAADATAIKTEVSAVYGTASDYPKGVLPPKSDKNHPDKLFPAGRPFWLIRDEKPPQAKIIMMGTVDACVKDGTIKLIDQQNRPETYTPYCEDVQDLHARDEEFFLDYRRVLANTVYNSCSMKAYAFGTLKLKDNGSKSSRARAKKVKFVPPNQCCLYTRKDQKKKAFTKQPFQVGSGARLDKKKKKQNSTIE